MQIEQYLLKENNSIPNNARLPLLLYRHVFQANVKDQFSQSFSKNGWDGQWVNGVFNYHHYHSTAHEALGVIEGVAKIMLGGPEGKAVDVEQGDLMILPAGTGHCRLEASDDFKVIGAYPKEQEDYDICTEKDNTEEKKKNIANVSFPQKDPVQDAGGVLKEIWR